MDNDEELMNSYIREIEEYTTSTPEAHEFGGAEEDGEMEEDGEYAFFRYQDGVPGSEDSGGDEEEENVLYEPREHNKKVESYVYIDDFNAVEIVDVNDAPMHMSTRKTIMNARAIKSERLFARINELADTIGMQVNSQKTQMLCINPRNYMDVNTYINYGPETIKSTNTMKILGFTFDERPNASKHVETTIDKFHARLWTLRFLKRSGLDEGRLLDVYNSVVRSAVEYCAVVYHSMIPRYLSDQLEVLQRRALKIIFGWNCDIATVMASKGIETLEARRESAVLKFALKNESVEKYGKRWFQKNEELDVELRPGTRNMYKEKRCRTERMKSNPVTHMTKMLNKHHRNEK